MADVAPQFEVQDNLGSTSHFNGTVGTSSTAIPTTPGSPIADVMISCLVSNTPTKNLLVSFDGGTNFFTLTPGTAMSWTMRGSATQFHIKGSAASTAYEIIVNREP
jgi:hypothetical protein